MKSKISSLRSRRTSPLFGLIDEEIRTEATELSLPSVGATKGYSSNFLATLLLYMLWNVNGTETIARPRDKEAAIVGERRCYLLWSRQEAREGETYASHVYIGNSYLRWCSWQKNRDAKKREDRVFWVSFLVIKWFEIFYPRLIISASLWVYFEWNLEARSLLFIMCVLVCII